VGQAFGFVWTNGITRLLLSFRRNKPMILHIGSDILRFYDMMDEFSSTFRSHSLSAYATCSLSNTYVVIGEETYLHLFIFGVVCTVVCLFRVDRFLPVVWNTPHTSLVLKISSRSAGSVWSGTVAAVRSGGCLFILFSRFFFPFFCQISCSFSLLETDPCGGLLVGGVLLCLV